ncbi:hypothetical protein [Achromobacter sp. NCFB-sbj8-Ac1-l]|uniref:hypothetical protein n=1 Tax=unclassified Achromobacter TaxID=2626865 RepID=UPI0040468F11
MDSYLRQNLDYDANGNRLSDTYWDKVIYAYGGTAAGFTTEGYTYDAMKDPHIKWEPVNSVPLHDIEEAISPLVVNKGGFSIMKNGTLLFINKSDDNYKSACLALSEAKYLTDFRVKKIANGNFLVALHGAVAVFVGAREFSEKVEEIKSRIDDLKFPGEDIIVPQGWTEEEFLAGLYGRAKMQRDVQEQNFYIRID